MNWVKTLKNVSFVILTLKMCIVFGQKTIIVIDPGHGGKDSGAVGINGIKEKDVVLNIAKEILKINRNILNDTFDIYLTRYKDSLVSLSDRSRLANSLDADIFVSLHCNASQTQSKGIEVYVHHSDSKNVKKSITLGLSVLNESTQKLGFKKRGVKFANFQVLRESVSLFPAVLVEMGFVTNANEVDYFLKPKNIRAMALAILLGIKTFMK